MLPLILKHFMKMTMQQAMMPLGRAYMPLDKLVQ